MSEEKVNVLCLKWGKRYPALYANRLYAGVKRHLARPFRFVCVTDNPDGLAQGIEAVPFPEDPLVPGRRWPNIFVKLLLFRDGFADLKGPTLFLDVDLIVTGPLDRFFDFRPGEFCIVHNWVERRKELFRKLPDIGNSSCFRFDAGASGGVYEAFLRDKEDPSLRHFFEKGSQKYQTRAMFENGRVNWWPKGWVASFKRDCHRIFPFNLILQPKKPKGASMICFHGRPDPTEAIEGYRFHSEGRKAAIHLRTRPAKWVEELWERG